MEITTKNHFIKKHNHTRNDPFFWLHKKNMKLIHKINQKTNQYFCDQTDIQNTLTNEIKQRMFEDDKSIINKYHLYYYFNEIKKNQNYPKYYLLKNKSSKPYCYLNLEKLSKKHSQFNIGSVLLSYDEKYVLYSIDYTGDLKYTLFMKSLFSNKIKKLFNFQISNDYLFHPDNQSIYYIRHDKKLRKNKLYNYDLNTHKNVLIFEEKDNEYSLSLTLSTDEKYIFLYSSKYEIDKIFLINNLTIKTIFSQKKKTEYKIDHFNNKYYLLTNKDKKINYELYESDNLTHWKCIFKHSIHIYIQSFIIHYDSIFLRIREKGFPKLLRMKLDTYKIKHIPFPSNFFSYYFTSNLNPYHNKLNLSYSSYTVPRIKYEYNLKNDNLKIIEKKKLTNFNPNDYKEGYFKIGKIIATYIYKKDKIKLDGKQSYPCYLYGYSSYGNIDDPIFEPEYMSLVDRGYLYVLPNLRGSNFYGPQWYFDGKLTNKKNTFYDFQTVAEYLIKQNYTSSDKLVIEGSSAGGLLIGSCINMNPSLYNVAILRVPFVDCLTTMLNKDIPLTLTEYDEWGNPDKYKSHYNYILSYSPYDNIDMNKEYPHIYIVTGLNDSQVQFYEPLKYYAKLTQNKYFKNNQKTLVIDIQTDTGHSGNSSRYQSIQNETQILSFILKNNN